MTNATDETIGTLFTFDTSGNEISFTVNQNRYLVRVSYDLSSKIQTIETGILSDFVRSDDALFYVSGNTAYHRDKNGEIKELDIDFTSNKELAKSSKYLYLLYNDQSVFKRYSISSPRNVPLENLVIHAGWKVSCAVDGAAFIMDTDPPQLSYLSENLFTELPSTIEVIWNSITAISKIDCHRDASGFVTMVGIWNGNSIFKLKLDSNLNVIELIDNWYSQSNFITDVEIRSGDYSSVQCADGIDNDNDGKIDYPGDVGCVSFSDNDESNTSSEDNCPNDPLKTEPGICGCGIVYNPRDSDGDLFPDCIDECLSDSRKILAGDCGCGVLDLDTDGDHVPDCNDQCDSNDKLSIAYPQCCEGNLSGEKLLPVN